MQHNKSGTQEEPYEYEFTSYQVELYRLLRTGDCKVMQWPRGEQGLEFAIERFIARFGCSRDEADEWMTMLASSWIDASGVVLDVECKRKAHRIDDL